MTGKTTKARSSGRQVRAVGHKASGGHSLHRHDRDPNTPPEHHRHRHMTFHEFPKWLHFDGQPSVLVQDADEEAVALSASKPRRGRPPAVDAPANECPANDAGGETGAEPDAA